MRTEVFAPEEADASVRTAGRADVGLDGRTVASQDARTDAAMDAGRDHKAEVGLDSRPDGRRVRGDASRRAILAAATQVIVEQGVAGVTHRAVAEAAGVPLARVSYHFARIDELLLAAARQYLEGFDARMADLAEQCRTGPASVVEACTDFLYELVTVGSREFLAVVEVRLALKARGEVVDDTAVVDVVASFGLGETRAATLVAAIFGFAVLAATVKEPPGRDQVQAVMVDLLGLAT